MQTTLSREEAEASIAGLQKQIERYADLAVGKGVAIREGQELVITVPVECADFARLLVRKAYAAGAGHVTVLWSDEETSLLEFENMDVDSERCFRR